jgi:hypothetical protein
VWVAGLTALGVAVLLLYDYLDSWALSDKDMEEANRLMVAWAVEGSLIPGWNENNPFASEFRPMKRINLVYYPWVRWVGAERRGPHLPRFSDSRIIERAKGDELLGYDLRLMPRGWGDGSGVPTSGNSLVIVGTDTAGRLHIRILDARGSCVLDTDETKLPGSQAEKISALKQQLPGLLSSQKAEFLREVASILVHTKWVHTQWLEGKDQTEDPGRTVSLLIDDNGRRTTLHCITPKSKVALHMECIWVRHLWGLRASVSVSNDVVSYPIGWLELEEEQRPTTTQKQPSDSGVEYLRFPGAP